MLDVVKVKLFFQIVHLTLFETSIFKYSQGVRAAGSEELAAECTNTNNKIESSERRFPNHVFSTNFDIRQ